MITESWLQPHKKRSFNIPGFKLMSVDRSSRRAGGVCMYARQNLSLNIVNKYTSTTVSAMWVALHCVSLPMLIYATIYHPPNLKKAECDQTIDYITSTISLLSTRYHNAKFIIYGDFNDLKTKPITDLFPLQQLAWFPAREQNTIDLEFTDIEAYANCPRTTCSPGPPIGRSDHKSIILSSAAKHKQKYTTVTKRVITEKAKIGISEDLASHNWDNVTSKSDPNLKAEVFQETVSRIVNKWCPIKNIRTPIGKQPISTPLIDKLRRAKSKAHQNGCLSWKYFGQLLELQLQNFQQSQCHKNINNSTAGSRTWLQERPKLTTPHHSSISMIRGMTSHNSVLC